MHLSRSLIAKFGAFAKRKSELLGAEAKLWEEFGAMLTVAAETAFEPLPQKRQEIRSADVPVAKPMLSVAETVDFLGVAPSTLAKWRLDGSGPKFVKLGRRTFYRRVDLDAFVAQHTFPHTSAYGLARKKR